jgi:hypothetical protein
LRSKAQRASSPSAACITERSGLDRPIWEPGGGYDRTIYSSGDFREKRLYIHRNACRAKLVSQP